MGIQIGDIFGDYQVTGILGRGGMGKVYRVKNLITDREEAMKVVLADRSDDPNLADRFLREIKVHASLRHPHIAALQTALRIEDRLVMILELVEGASLEDMIRNGPIESRAAVDYFAQVLSALGYAHERGVIHRDIKPANILIAAGGVAKLTDFGIARASGMGRLTGTGLAIGTMAYMSPEQVRGEQADARSDIYSLGLTFYEAVTGQRAIDGDNVMALLSAQRSMIPPEPTAVSSFVPAAVSAAIMRSLAKEPERRYQTALEFQSALRDLRQPHGTAGSSAGGSTVSMADLADLESRLSRAIGPISKRLVADAARRYGSIGEIRRVLAAEIQDPRQREKFLDTAAQTTTAQARTPTAPTEFDTVTLDRLTRALAPHVGPIAKVLVGRAASKARDLTELENSLAAEVAGEDDRRRFLATLRSAL